MKILKVPIIHWPRFVVATCVGHLALWLMTHGKQERGMRVATIADRLWRGI